MKSVGSNDLVRFMLVGAVLAWAAVVGPSVRAQALQSRVASNVIVSGHLDIQAVGRNAELRENDFQVGQMALAVLAELGKRTQAAVEIAYGDGRQIDIDKAFIDWNVYRWDGQPRQQSLGSVSVDVRAGQFDVPFGIAWRTYRSTDRKLVSLPMVIANTHRGWNDLGVQVYGVTTWSNWAVYAVNGLSSSPLLRLPVHPGTIELVAEADEGEDAATHRDVVPTEVFGARFGLVMNPQIEFGTSFAAGYTHDNDQDERLFGFDATARFNALELKAEFINHQHDRASDKKSLLGYYIEGSHRFGRAYAAIRQDVFDADGEMVYPLDQRYSSSLLSTSFGAGYNLGEGAQLRGEYQLAEGRRNDMLYLQTVVAF